MPAVSLASPLRSFTFRLETYECGTGGWQIHIKDGVIYDAALNQTNASNNNNKFYIIQLLEKGSTMKTWTRWGRVGEYGATATLPGTYQAFEKKFKDKSGLSWENRLSAPRAGKYTYIERNYEDDDEEEDKPKKEKKVKNEDDEDVEEIERKPAECTLAEPVRDVVSLIFNTHHFQTTMADMEYDANKLPLGKLSKRTLQMGFQLLKDLAELVSNPGLADSKYSTTQGRALEQLSNQYFTVIPHSFGRRRPPIIHDQVLIKREVDLLDALTDMEIANEIMNVSKSSKAAYDVHPLDQQYMGLKLREMMPRKFQLRLAIRLRIGC
jgi:poly [ADP-ribose] polymerase